MGNTYRAFISYSHNDAADARWLHARLETYRLPGDIARLAAAGARKGRLGPIFRDREELPASEDLSASVRAALAVSDVLVVLCSPDARASPWVQREIELFRELGPDRPILAAIVRGEPADAIPAALLDGREPHAADLRKHGDGRRLGFLKIVAGIAAVPLDSLVQRDAQRNLRRVTAVTLVTATAALAMGIMTLIAIQSRNEADRQRGEAVAMATYMSTELRDKLRGVGRLELMAEVIERALAYCKGQGEPLDIPLDSREGCARALHASVEIETNRKEPDLEIAAREAALAYRMTSSLVEARPREADFIFDHAQSEYWVGRVFEIREDYLSALPLYEAYDRSARLLHRLEPASPRTYMERGFGALNLGILSFRIDGSGERPVDQFEAAIGWFERVVARDPRDEYAQQQLANAWSWLSNVHYNAGDFAASLASQEHAARLRQQLVRADPLHRERQFELLVARRALALSRSKLGQRDAARVSLAGLAHEATALSARDPANRDWSYLVDLMEADLRNLN
jgi:tetratricopeptide (TPR) repeat protein